MPRQNHVSQFVSLLLIGMSLAACGPSAKEGATITAAPWTDPPTATATATLVSTPTYRPAFTPTPMGGGGLGVDGNDLSIGSLRRHISYLASDKMAGRWPGTDGYDQAAVYAAEIFAGAGLLPGWTDENGQASFFQPVGLVRYQLNPSYMLSLRTDMGEQTLLPGQPNYAVFSPGGSNGMVGSGRVVYVGYGIYAPEHGRDDFEGLDLNGAIVIVLSGIPGSMTGVVNEDMKIEAIIERGATAVLVISGDDGLPDHIAGVQQYNYFVTDVQMPPIIMLYRSLTERLFTNQPYNPLDSRGQEQTFELEGVELTLSVDVSADEFDSANVGLPITQRKWLSRLQTTCRQTTRPDPVLGRARAAERLTPKRRRSRPLGRETRYNNYNTLQQTTSCCTSL